MLPGEDLPDLTGHHDQPGHPGGTGEDGHGHGVTASSDSRYITVALALIAGFLVFEVVMAFIGHSLALLADAGHMLTDAGALGASLMAIGLARRPASGVWTFGFKRAEVLSAQANGITDTASAAGAEPATRLHRRAIRLEQFSAGWMLIEAGVAVTAGIVAGSLALTSFGFNSVIELVSAILVLGRLRAELSGGRASDQAERRVLRIIAVTFFVLAAYVVVASVIELAARAHPERSPAGIGLTISSLLVMPLLGWRKRNAGTALRNQLVLADAAEAILCATLAATTLAGLVLFAAFGWWWADPVAALAIAWFAVREGREAWHGELACDD